LWGLPALSCPTRVPQNGDPAIAVKPFSVPDENVLKQNCAYPRITQTGDGIMQFILNLLWEHSRSSYLAAMAEQETCS
jgi:hypothetical protein